MLGIDLNCDLGEGAGNDEALMPFITSANVACGLHAGDALTMTRTVRWAKQHGVAVGAHPGYADREHFGRRALNMPPDEIESLVRYQLGVLAAIASAEGVALTHVKPHGALYNQAATDRAVAQAIVDAVIGFDRALTRVGLAGSILVEVGLEAGLRVANEGFPDRAYNPDGTLMSRGLPGAVLESVDAVAANAVRLATQGIMFGTRRIAVDTLCIHGDGPQAVGFARAVRAALVQHHVQLTRL
jgi:UPF0271 protein